MIWKIRNDSGPHLPPHLTAPRFSYSFQVSRCAGATRRNHFVRSKCTTVNNRRDVRESAIWFIFFTYFRLQSLTHKQTKILKIKKDQTRNNGHHQQ
jgi:hypothetical protein